MNDAEFCAEKILGWTYDDGQSYLPPWPPFWKHADRDPLLQPGETWAFAGRVIEAMRERGFYITVTPGRFDYTAATQPRPGGVVSATMETGPEAILAAARKARCEAPSNRVTSRQHEQ